MVVRLGYRSVGSITSVAITGSLSIKLDIVLLYFIMRNFPCENYLLPSNEWSCDLSCGSSTTISDDSHEWIIRNNSLRQEAVVIPEYYHTTAIFDCAETSPRTAETRA